MKRKDELINQALTFDTYCLVQQEIEHQRYLAFKNADFFNQPQESCCTFTDRGTTRTTTQTIHPPILLCSTTPHGRIKLDSTTSLPLCSRDRRKFRRTWRGVRYVRWGRSVLKRSPNLRVGSHWFNVESNSWSVALVNIGS